MLMDISPVRAEQFLGVGDQRVEMLVALALGFVVSPIRFRQTRRAGQYGRGAAHIFLTMRRRHLRRHVAHVAALIGIGQERNGNAVLFEVTQPGRQTENVHLPAGIIDVILAGHIPAGESQQAGQRSAVSGTAAVTDVQWPGRVGRDKLDLHLLPATLRRTAIILAFSQYGADHIDLGAGIQRKVDEPGTGHFRLDDQL